MSKEHITVHEDWLTLVSMLPEDLAESCIDKLAIGRFREIRSASDLLRLCFAYAVCDLSLRQTAAWASSVGLAELSNVAVMKRVRGASDWLGHLVLQWLRERGLASDVPAMAVRIVDGTTVTTPGKHPTDYRLHAAFDLAAMRMTDVELTEHTEGESLARHAVNPGEVVLADRNYGKRKQLAHVLSQGGHVVVRINYNNMPLETKKGRGLDLLALLETLGAGEMGDWPVYMRHNDQVYPMRLVAVRKSREATERAIAKVTRRAQRNQAKAPDARAKRAAHYTYVLTDLPHEAASTTQVLELYRMRWQVELAFKRIKSLLQLDLRAKSPDIARSYLFSNILASLMIEELAGDALAFFPWGFPLTRTPRQPLAAL